MIEIDARVEGPDDLRELAFDAAAQAVWIGRSPSCQIVLASDLVSRRHACVALEAGAFWVSDCSVNGTRVNGARLHRDRRRIEAHVRIEIEIGPYRVHLARSASARAASAVPVEVRRRVQRALLEQLDLAHVALTPFDPERMRPQVHAALERACALHRGELPDERARRNLIAELTDEALGFGPLEALLSDAAVSEIMVVDPNTIYVERGGRIEPTALCFTDDDAVRAVIERIVTPLGRRIDESSPLVDARLPDGSRVNAVIPPLARRGPCITLRKFPSAPLTLSQLIEGGSMSRAMADLLCGAVRARRNVVVSGGTGSGKTTLLNVLSSAIPEAERIVTIEDAAELRLRQPHVVSLEARPPNLEGKGAYTIRDLVRNALRMRPDRIVVGECRGGEALDMLQAMNTGHEGSMTTTHANSPAEALARLETLALMAGIDLPASAIRRQIASSVHLIVQQDRFADGSRRVTSICEVLGLNDAAEIDLAELYCFERATGAGPEVHGSFEPTGRLPSFAYASEAAR
jgi:pilus assembly protein CpaF